jgi:hypothetical protein
MSKSISSVPTVNSHFVHEIRLQYMCTNVCIRKKCSELALAAAVLSDDRGFKSNVSLHCCVTLYQLISLIGKKIRQSHISRKIKKKQSRLVCYIHSYFILIHAVAVFTSKFSSTVESILNSLLCYTRFNTLRRLEAIEMKKKLSLF